MEQPGSFPLTGVGPLPNASRAFPGEHWSDRVGSGVITPGEAILPAGSATPRGLMVMRTAESGDSAAAAQIALALRPVEHPDPDAVLGPNEIVNRPLDHGDYVRAAYSGAFHLTLVRPDTYVPGDLVGWEENGPLPEGKEAAGCWAKNASADINSIFEVILWRPYGDSDEGILTVRFVNRSQM